MAKGWYIGFRLFCWLRLIYAYVISLKRKLVIDFKQLTGVVLKGVVQAVESKDECLS